MNIIPVIDIRLGQVVHAQEGRRTTYAPLYSSLCPDASPITLFNNLRSLYGSRQIYIADLDAIEGSGDNFALLDELTRQHSDTEIWLDAGLSDLSSAHTIQSLDLRPVIGSETLREPELLTDLEHPLLSLDFLGEQLLGPEWLFENSDCWPQEIILMALAKVGSDTGPDMELLQQYREKFGDKNLFTAGGIRNLSDLQQVHSAGAAGALVASVLHAGCIHRADLENINRSSLP